MKNSILFIIILLITVNSMAQNVMISNKYNPNEPAIVMNPKKLNVLVAAANLNNYYYSVDSGYTWTERTLTSSHGVWGDPVVAVDNANDFYFFHLSNPSSGNWIDRIVCQKSLDNGATWTNGSYAGLNGTKAQDKQWCAIDRANNNIYLTWTQFDKYGSANVLDSTVILFSKSTDAGGTWSAPKRINKQAGDCIDDDQTVEGAVPAVGPNGEVYVAWAGPSGLVFNKSLDQGNTWLSSEILIDPMPTGWAYSIPGVSRANGLPITACDTSNGPNRGAIYVNWSDQRNGATDTDIWLAKSMDGGQTWSAPKRVNNDNTTRQQFFTWMTIDQTNGYLYFIFYDRRNYTNLSTDVYLAVSMDGGSTFINSRISESPFIPNSGVFFGDYTNITAHAGVIRPIWTRLHNGQLSMWTDITSHKDLLVSTSILPISESDLTFENFPNPASETVFVSFKLHAQANINLFVYNQKGDVVCKIISNEKRGYGKYVERINLNKLRMPSGVYFLRLDIDNTTKVNKQIIIK